MEIDVANFRMMYKSDSLGLTFSYFLIYKTILLEFVDYQLLF